MILKDSILNEIKNNPALRRALMGLHEKSEFTILKYLRENSPELIKYTSLQVISAYLKKEIDDMIIKDETDFREVV